MRETLSTEKYSEIRNGKPVDAATPCYRFVKFMGCRKCRIETSVGECCPKCGGTFMGGQIDMSLTRKEVWRPIPRKWWNPATWDGGKWVSCDNTHLSDRHE